MLIGETLVVKLFGHFRGRHSSYESELVANRAVAENDGIDSGDHCGSSA